MITPTTERTVELTPGITADEAAPEPLTLDAINAAIEDNRKRLQDARRWNTERIASLHAENKAIDEKLAKLPRAPIQRKKKGGAK
jgi:vacuolar-type H+-ATPase subunit H